MLNASQSQMNRAALSALSVKRTPPLTMELFAMMPTVSPSIRPKPMTSSPAQSGLISKKRVLVDQSVDHGVDVERHGLALRDGVLASAGADGSSAW